MGNRVCVLLSGCGGFDGVDIQEAVLTMLFLDKAGADIICAAPRSNQLHVLNHLTQEEMGASRNVLIESARIARGDILDLKTLTVDTIDALIIPGGFGAIKNLSDFVLSGPDATVHPEVQRILGQTLDAGKPIGAMSIAPTTVVRVLYAHGPVVTIGYDKGTAAAIQTMGGKHQSCMVQDIVVDQKNKIVTTPTYMLASGIKEIATGIEKLVEKVLALAE